MEKNSNRMIIILSVVVFLLCIYISGDKLFAYSKKTDSTTSYNLEKRSNIQATRQGYIEVLVDTEGNAYLYTIGSVDNESDSKVKENIKKIESQFQTYSPKEYDYYGSTELKAYKLDVSKVLTTYYVHMGNGGFSYFIFLKENGNLSYLNYDKLIYDGEIEVVDIENLNNVVSVVENTYSMTPYVITSDGNEISLYNNIK